MIKKLRSGRHWPTWMRIEVRIWMVSICIKLWFVALPFHTLRSWRFALLDFMNASMSSHYLDPQELITLLDNHYIPLEYQHQPELSAKHMSDLSVEAQSCIAQAANSTWFMQKRRRGCTTGTTVGSAQRRWSKIILRRSLHIYPTKFLRAATPYCYYQLPLLAIRLMASVSQPALLGQFEDALEAFTQNLSDTEKADFQFATVTEVHLAIDRIQKDQERKHLLRGLKRITPFVDGLVRYSAVIEQFVTMNPAILAAIWGPLKFLLQVSKNAKKSFDIIISALAKIGHCLPRFVLFAEIFKQSPRFSQVLAWLYTDVLEFYSEVLKFFRKNRKEAHFLSDTP